MPADIDTIRFNSGGFVGGGRVAQALLQNNFSINALRTCDVLRKDEWKRMDEVLIEIAHKRLTVVGDLVSRGLTYQLPNALGTTILEWEQVSDLDVAHVSMSGVTEGENDTLDFSLKQMPIPIIHKGFNINIRKLEASRKTGQPLDTAQLENCTRVVAETIETMVFNGHALREGTARIYGLTTEPNRNTGSLTANWATATGSQIVTDVLAMMKKCQDDHMYGPYALYVPYDAWIHMNEDFKAESDKTIIARIQEIPDLAFVKPSRDVTAGQAIMFQLSRDVIDEIMGIQPTLVQWESHGGMVFHYKVMAIMLPRVRSTYTNQSGISHYTA